MNALILGCDVSKDDIHVCLYEIARERILGSRKFVNTDNGFAQMLQWCQIKSKGAQFDCVMESTGIYHENFVEYFHSMGIACYVVLPRLIKNYAKSHNIRLKNDKADARTIAAFGTEIGDAPRKIKVQPWTPFTKSYKELRVYLRQILMLTKERSRLKCQLHALSFVKSTPDAIISSMNNLIQEYNTLIEDYKDKALDLAVQDKEMYARVQKISTIKGVTDITVLHILSETNGFALFKSARQLTAYAGLDIPDRQSGRCRKPGHISKCGNARIRQVLYMPAICFGNNGGEKISSFYANLKKKFGQNRGNQAVIAVERKLLCLIYTLWKNDTCFDGNHTWNPIQH